jgi:hypothetical protein
MVTSLIQEVTMFKASLVSLIVLAGATAAQAALPPVSAPAAIMPNSADCVRSDAVSCVYRVVSTADLDARGGEALTAPAGLPTVERIEVRRIDDGSMLLLEYFAPDPALQGVAL